MSKKETNTTAADSATIKNNSETPDILAVATRQRAIMMTLLAYILVILGSMFLPVVRQNEIIIMVPVILAIIIFAARLCWVIYGKGFAIVLTALCCIPYLNIIIILMASSRATKILKENGLKVGLLGANIKEVEALAGGTATAG